MTEIKPVAWRWEDEHGCVYITGDERRSDVPEQSIPLCLHLEAAAEIERLTDKVEGLSADLDSAIEVAFKRGATDWVRLNYPEHYARLSGSTSASCANN